MRDLTAPQRRLLDRLHQTQRWTVAVGLVLTLSGLAYTVWGIGRFDPTADPRERPGFDGPVASLAFAFDVHERRLQQIRPETFTEEVLMETLMHGIHFSTGFVILLMRIFLGTLTMVTGLVALTVVVERRRLLAIIHRMDPSLAAPEGPAAPPRP